MVKCVERDMKCPSCKSTILSYSSDVATLEDIVSCWNCGKSWTPSEEDEIFNPTWRKVLKMEKKYC